MPRYGIVGVILALASDPERWNDGSVRFPARVNTKPNRNRASQSGQKSR